MSQFINPQNLKNQYEANSSLIKEAKEKLGRALTLTEKILFTHFYNSHTNIKELKRGESDLALKPDRVIMQDATAQMAVLQFISAQAPKVAAPSSIHCDHLIRACDGGKEDLEKAKIDNKEVYEFLGSAARKYGMDFWEPGSGIIHTIALENYVAPGQLMIGTDSHTPTGGGLGMMAIGVGGADAVDVMTDQPWQLKNPKIVGITLKGKLLPWASAKDVILYLCGKLSVKGGTGKVLEYFGEGADTLDTAGKATITNMGAEVGATTSLFPYDEAAKDYLKATCRADIAEITDKYSQNLRADDEVLADPEKYYDEVIEIDLAKIEPSIAGPDTPDAYWPLSRLKKEYAQSGLPQKVSTCLIGSCTNSSYRDFKRAASILENASKNGLKLKTDLLVSPGSNQVAATLERDGILDIFRNAGAIILTNSCGPCIGQWDRQNAPEGENAIVTTFNRNFKKRNDGRVDTKAFLAGAEFTVALALAGVMAFDPANDTIANQAGEEIKLEIADIEALPEGGFADAPLDYVAPAQDGSGLEVIVDPKSERIQLLEPFNKWEIDKDFNDLYILVKAQGKCTTDHISPAGPWLKYRGHLDNISQNMYSGATNAFSGEAGKGKNLLTGAVDEFQKNAREYKKAGIGWVVIGDENYGEGSSREHAAMEPRFLGARAVIAKSFARIAETNLKKQGILALTLQNGDDHNKFREDDKIDIEGLENLIPGSEVEIVIKHADGSEEKVKTLNSLSAKQIKWFYAGSALNSVNN